MAPVDPLQAGHLQNNYLAPQTQEKRKVEKKGSVKRNFTSLLSSGLTEASREAEAAPPEDLPLEELLDEIHQVGERLSFSPTMAEVMAYKRAVKNFVSHVVANSYELVEQEGVKFANPMKKQKKFTIVKIIDEKLEKLAAQILQNQKNRLEILAAVNEIQGLLIDLMR